jgi:hypothetical protein
MPQSSWPSSKRGPKLKLSRRARGFNDDCARTDFAIIESDLEAIYARVARIAEPRSCYGVSALSGHEAAPCLRWLWFWPSSGIDFGRGWTKFARMSLEAAVIGGVRRLADGAADSRVIRSARQMSTNGASGHES